MGKGRRKEVEKASIFMGDEMSDIEKSVELIGGEYTFSLPEWVADEKYEYSVPRYYDKNHAYAGSYSHTNNENRAYDILFDLPMVKEVCLHPMGQWLTVEVGSAPGRGTTVVLNKFRKRLIKALKELKAWEPLKEEEEHA